MFKIFAAATGSFALAASAFLGLMLLHFRIDERADANAAVWGDFAVGFLVANSTLLIVPLFGKWSLRQILILEFIAVSVGVCVSLSLLDHHRWQIKIRSEKPSGLKSYR